MNKTAIIILLVFGMLRTYAQDMKISFAGTGSASVIDSIKVYNLSDNTVAEVTLKGSDTLRLVKKPMIQPLDFTHFKSVNITIEMLYTAGNRLLFKAISGKYSTIVTDIPAGDKIITFKFDTCTDADGNNYPIVQIGNQVWMAQNLKVGSPILGSQEQTNNTITEKYCYSDNIDNCNIYGGLYQWNEIMNYATTPGIKGICPAGWHVPARFEWDILSAFLGGDSTAGNKMRSTCDTTHHNCLWEQKFNADKAATNASGFTALPGGNREITNKNFSMKGMAGYWWSSSQSSVSFANCRMLRFTDSILHDVNDQNKEVGISVRCIRGYPTGINDHVPNQNNIKIYPNPATDKISIVFSHATQAAFLVIYDVIGNIVLQQQIDQAENDINIEKLSRGMYIIRISEGQTIVQKKLVKE